MLLAATYAGIGFGNAGVHLPHGMSYPVAGMVRDYRPAGYRRRSRDRPARHVGDPERAGGLPLHGARPIPSGISARPKLLGADVQVPDRDDAGEILADRVIEIMRATGMPNGSPRSATPKPTFAGWSRARCRNTASPNSRRGPPPPTISRAIFQNALRYW